MSSSDIRRTAFITAAGQGIGRATAFRLAQSGYALMLVDRDAVKVEATAAALREGGAEVEVTVGDAVNEADIRDAVARTLDRFGRLDSLACVAGGAGPDSVQEVDDITPAQWNYVIALNLNSIYLACHHAVPIMREQKYGRIAALSSTVARGRLGPVGTMGARLPYATAKAGIIGLVKQLAKDVGRFGITANCVMPWLTFGDPGTNVRENFFRQSPDYQERTLAMSPQGRPVSAEGVAAAMAFLLSEEAGYVSGVAMPVDGAVLN